MLIYALKPGGFLLFYTDKKVNKKTGKCLIFVSDGPCAGSALSLKESGKNKLTFIYQIIYSCLFNKFSDKLISLGLISLIPKLLAISLPYIKLNNCKGEQSFNFFLL